MVMMPQVKPLRAVNVLYACTLASASFCLLATMRLDYSSRRLGAISTDNHTELLINTIQTHFQLKILTLYQASPWCSRFNYALLYVTYNITKQNIT